MKKTLTFILIILSICSLSCQRDFKQNTGEDLTNMKADIIDAKSLAYDYPVKPGTPQWKQLRSNEEKIKACLIPDNILSSLSTQDLLDVCLEYPLLNNIYAFADIEKGIDKLFKDFNGIRELAKRPDALDKFVNEYKNRVGKIEALNENSP